MNTENELEKALPIAEKIDQKLTEIEATLQSPKPEEKKPIFLRSDAFPRRTYPLKHCRWVMADGKYVHWDENHGWSYSSDRSKAKKFTVDEAYGTFASYGSYIELVDQELAAKLAKKRCLITNALSQTTITLLSVEPMNPQGRTQVLATIGKPIPEALKTYDEIKDWVEENHGQSSMEGFPPAPLPEDKELFKVEFSFSDTERGRANVEVETSATGEVPITANMLQEVLRESPEASVIEISKALVRALHSGNHTDPVEYAQNWERNWKTVQISGFDLADNDGVDSAVSDMDEFRKQIEDHLRATLTPEQLKARGIQ